MFLGGCEDDVYYPLIDKNKIFLLKKVLYLYTMELKLENIVFDTFYKRDLMEEYNFTEEEYLLYLECDYKLIYDTTK